MTTPGFCPCCDRPSFHWHQHHVVGRAQGGTDAAVNLVRVCPDCHHALHAGRRNSDPHIRLVVYARHTNPRVGMYSDMKKWPGWLEERYLGYGSRSGVG